MTTRTGLLGLHWAVLGASLLGCGARAEQGRALADQAPRTTQAPKVVVAIEPAPSTVSTLTPQPSVDAVLSNPNLAPGVLSVIQPAFFGDPEVVADAGAPDASADVNLQATGDAGTSLAGNGDLTVLLVFDKSSSMLFDWHGVSRWQVANESLRASLEGILDTLTIGVVRFPLGGECAVAEFSDPSQIGFTSGRQFVELWRNMEHHLDSLGTPLGNALEVADRAITQAKADGRLEQRFRVVLVTDGEPTCGESTDSMVALVQGWRELGVETLVLGLPGSDAAAETLRRIAEGGGTGQVRVANEEGDLDRELHRAVR